MFHSTSPSRRGEGTYSSIQRTTQATRTRTVFYLLGITAIVGWFYVLFMSDIFVINSVEVMGLKSLDPIDVNREVLNILDERTAWRPWSPRHAWFINREDLAEKLKQRLFAENVTVDKTYTHILRLKVEDRSQKFILHSHQQYLWVDIQGTVLAHLTPDELKQIQTRPTNAQNVQTSDPPIIRHDQDNFMSAGFHVADDAQVKLWLQNASEAIQQGFIYREFAPPSSPTSSRGVFTSLDGDQVIVDVSASLEPQITNYLAFKKNQPKNLKVTEYVDVRVPGRVYVK